MISNFESQAEDVREELPREKFILESPLGGGLVAATTLTVKTQEAGFAIETTEPNATLQEEASPSSRDLLSQLARSAERNLLRFPQSARAHANLGAAFLKAGRLLDAERELRIALEIDPNHYLGAMTFAKLYMEQGKLSEAEALYKGLLESGTLEPLIPINLANIAMSRGEYDKAATIIQSAMSLAPIARHYILGTIRIHEGNNREAIKELKAALMTDIRSPQLNHALGIAYATSGDHRRAEKYLKAALVLDPNSRISVRALGTVLLEANRVDQAVQLIHSYLEKCPSDGITRELLGRCYLRLEKPSMARTQFKLALADRESIPEDEQAKIYCNLGVAYMLEKNYREAEKELVRSLALDSNRSPIPMDNYARALIFGFQDYRRALGVLQKAKESFPENVDTRILLALVYGRQNQYEAAIDELRVIHSADSVPEITAHLGWLYEKAGDLLTGVKVLRAAFLRHPKHRSVINNLAYTLLCLGEIDEARAVIRSFPKDVEPHPEFVATQGLLRLCEGDVDAARRLYKRAEVMAKKTSDRDLVKRVRQKMHVEMAKHFLRVGDVAQAEREIYFAKLEHVKLYSFEDEIEQVSRTLKKK